MNRYKQDNSYFEKIDTERKAYWLGLLYADGCIYEKSENNKIIILGLHSDDKYIIEEFMKDIKTNRPIYITKREFVSLSISSTKMANDLIRLGCTPRKSLTLKFPSEEIVPCRLINHFIRGYMDGDGCISTYYKMEKGRKTPRFKCEVKFIGTYDMLEHIRIHFESDKKVLVNKHSSNSYQISFSGRKYLRKVSLLYEDATVYLVRKKEKLDEYISYINRMEYNLEGKPVVQLDLMGNKVFTYKNAYSANNFDPSAIGRCCKGYKSCKTHKGFRWMYESDYIEVTCCSK